MGWCTKFKQFMGTFDGDINKVMDMWDYCPYCGAKFIREDI